jgi:tetratricopeptide (TPR) repeat protein
MSDQEVSRIKSQARVLIDAGRFAEAATTLTHGLAAEPRDYELLCLMSQALLSARRQNEAAGFAEQAIAEQPDSSWGHRLRSSALRTSKPREALKSAQRAVECEPHEPFNWHALGRAQLEVRNLKAARTAAEQMRTLAPESFWSHQLLGLVAMKQKRYKEAELHCRRELELNPNSYYGMNNLGVALLNKRQTKDAIKVLNLAAKMNPSEELARRNLRIAARRYVPGVGLFIFAAAGLVHIYTKTGADMPGLIWVILALSVVVALSFWLLRRYRLQQIPAETQSYLRSLKRSARLAEIRDFLSVSAVIFGALFLVSTFIAFVNWSDGGLRWHLIAFAICTTFLTVTLASVFGVRRLPRSRV